MFTKKFGKMFTKKFQHSTLHRNRAINYDISQVTHFTELMSSHTAQSVDAELR